MMLSVYFKSAARRYLRTLFLLLLLGAVAFVFVSSIAEYIVYEREIAKLNEHERVIGMLQPTTPGGTNITAGAEIAEDSPYVSFADRRRICSGILDMHNTDFTSRGATDIMFVYGELLSKSARTAYINVWEGGELIRQHEDYHSLTIKVDDFYGVYPEYVGENWEVNLYIISDGTTDKWVEEMQAGKRYFIKAGNRHYRFDERAVYFNIAALNGDNLWFLQVEAGESLDFDSPELAGLKDELDILHENQRTMRVIATKDMTVMPEISEAPVMNRLYLQEGRWLNHEDNIEGRRVCIINNKFAHFRNLSVGDIITVKLRDNFKFRDFEFSWWYGDDQYIKSNEPWRELPVHEEQLEIVGIYNMRYKSDGSVISSRETTFVYIPDSVMPADYGGNTLNQANAPLYNFVLDSYKNQDIFISENREAFEKLGIYVSFIANNSASFWAVLEPLRRAKSFGAAIYGLTLLLALALASFLYLRQTRTDFAIQRALGLPAKTAVYQMLAPISLIGFTGIIAGGFSAWKYALSKSADIINNIIKNQDKIAAFQARAERLPEFVPPSFVWLIMICAGIFAILILFLFIGARRIYCCPVLELIYSVQFTGNNKQVAPADFASDRYDGERNVYDKIGYTPALTRKKSYSYLALVRHSFRHIRRIPVKSALTAAVAVSSVLTLGWISWTIDSNKERIDRIHESTVVRIQVLPINGMTVIPNKIVYDILKLGFVRNAYLETVDAREITVSGDDYSDILTAGDFASVKFNIKPEQNRELDEYRRTSNRVFAIQSKSQDVVFWRNIIWDDELRQIVKPIERTLSLLAVLYPVTIAVSVIIAAGLAVLLVLQSAKRAAILRVLGTTKLQVRLMLSCEQLVLCTGGLLIGLAALLITQGAAYITPPLICAGLYLTGASAGSAFAAVSATKRMPLELLQVKE